MKETQQILDLWSVAERAGESAVLATVVKTHGSSYRLPGARLLLTRTGQRAGSISGGCLEDDLIKKAWWLTESGPVIRRYDTTPEGEIASGYGLGCNGVVYVLLERVVPGRAEILDLLREVRATRRAKTVAHVLEPAARAGERLVLDDPGAGVLQDLEAFIEILAPPVHLLIFGAGDDAVPLADTAKYLGWRVSVFDGRAHYARRERFPDVDELIARPPAKSAAAVSIDPWTVAVLMSHSYSQDLEAVRELSSKPLRYLGILGPRKRSMQLLADTGLDPLRLMPALHSPMGLDIGADGPHQVALAVAAEIQAALNGRPGGLLREGRGSIHAPGEASGPAADWVQSIVCA
ncbi:MAG TPA: XdhC family protein [Bryobacteraceae bacterium]|jgi:xanthine/CO dehydrogenase XdhC/CoxF family maturation factor|nr:XdhC family protein [Bryobacteraceae bacterium]